MILVDFMLQLDRTTIDLNVRLLNLNVRLPTQMNGGLHCVINKVLL